MMFVVAATQILLSCDPSVVFVVVVVDWFFC